MARHRPRKPPPPFRKYAMKFVVLPGIPLMTCSTILALFFPDWVRSQWGEASVFALFGIPMALMMLPVLYYFIFLAPPRRKRPQPWWKVLLYSSALAMAEASLDEKEEDQSILNRPLINFRGKAFWALITYFWCVLIWYGIVIIRILIVSSEATWVILAIFYLSIDAALLIYFTRWVRERREYLRSARSEKPSPDSTGKPMGFDSFVLNRPWIRSRGRTFRVIVSAVVILLALYIIERIRWANASSDTSSFTEVFMEFSINGIILAYLARHFWKRLKRPARQRPHPPLPTSDGTDIDWTAPLLSEKARRAQQQKHLSDGS